MTASCSKQKKLSLEEVIAGVLQSDEESELSSFEESESELGDFEDEEGNQMLFVPPQTQISFVPDPVDRQPLLQESDTDDEDYVDCEPTSDPVAPVADAEVTESFDEIESDDDIDNGSVSELKNSQRGFGGCGRGSSRRGRGSGRGRGVRGQGRPGRGRRDQGRGGNVRRVRGRAGRGRGGRVRGVKARGNNKPPPVITWTTLSSDKSFENSNSSKPYLEHPGVQRCATQADSPLDHLLLFFPTELLEEITFQSNLYHDQVNRGKQTRKPWTPICVEEVKAFFGINIAMGIVNLPAMRDYWSSGLSQVPWFPAIMSVGRFDQICQYLHLADNEKTPGKEDSEKYKLYKLGNIADTVNETSRKCYTPDQQLSIDEQMVGTKSRISFLQYMPKKPKKFGVKLWVLAEALTGYCLNFQIYTGKCNDEAEKGLTYRVVMDLMNPYFDKNHNLYFDNFYTSPKLLKDLIPKGTYACGTIRVNRGVFPDDFKGAKLAPGDALFLQEGNVVATHWKDKRDVFMVSAIHDNKMIEVPKRRGGTISKPNMIIQYNKFMGGVDKCDQYISYYSLGRKTIKWWKKIFFRLFEIAIVNSMVIYFQKNPDFQKKKNSHKKFREILANELVQPLLDKRAEGEHVVPGPGRKSVSHDVRLKGKHFPVRIEKRGRCTACGYKRKRGGKYKDTKTYNFGTKCDKYVCKDCFEVFHTQSKI